MTDSSLFQDQYARARQGDRIAQEALLETVRPRLVRFLERQMGQQARRITEPDDVAQSALLDLLERIDRFPEDLDEMEFRAYAVQLGRWRLAGLFQRAHRDEGESMIPVTPAAPAGEAGIVTREDDRAWTRRLIDALDQKYRDVLKAYHVDGLTIAETAEELGLTPDAVKQRLSRGRRLLREKMAGEWSGRSR